MMNGVRVTHNFTPISLCFALKFMEYDPFRSFRCFFRCQKYKGHISALLSFSFAALSERAKKVGENNEIINIHKYKKNRGKIG
jgi:hypothetical protein